MRSCKLGESELVRVPRDLYDGLIDVCTASRRSCLIFAVDVAHCIAVTEAFRKAGVYAGYVRGLPPLTALTGVYSAQIVGQMKAHERVEVLDAFRRGQIPVLINVNVLTEGTVGPCISCW